MLEVYISSAFVLACDEQPPPKETYLYQEVIGYLHIRQIICTQFAAFYCHTSYCLPFLTAIQNLNRDIHLPKQRRRKR